MSKTYIIAEIGVNHNGKIDQALKLVEEAVACGADAVKFQTFQAETLATKLTPKVRYQLQTTGDQESHQEMLKQLELSMEDHHVINSFCKERKIDFLSTPYSVSDVEFLEKLDLPKIKVASADIVDLRLLKAIAKTGKSIILSTGMATLGEIENGINAIYAEHNSDITLLHCVSNYPCSSESLNMRVLQTLAHAFQLPIGYSDHHTDMIAAILAVGYGAVIIEKHFTLDKTLPGPDHAASADPMEFKQYCQAIREAEIMLGSPIKRCQSEERDMARVSRKSITLARDLGQGTVITDQDLVMRRPGTGLYAEHIDELIGKRLKYNLPRDHQVHWSDFD